jgi:hypothetical protein
MNTTHHAVLFALLDMAQGDCHATVIRLVERVLPLVSPSVAVDRATVEATLADLDRAGLVDASRVRLTLPGLAIAAGLGAPRAARRRAPIAKKAA